MSRLLLMTATLAHLAHLDLDERSLTEERLALEALPSTDALQLLSLGYDSLVADYYWLRSLEHFGSAQYHGAAYPNLEPLLSRVLFLDPYFTTAYTFAGTALTLRGMDPGASSRLLERGLSYRPDVWQIPFYLGFNRYYFEQEFEGAAEMLARAATLPGAPEIAGRLATRLAAEASRPEVGMRLVDAMLEGEKDPKLREEYEQRRKLLQLEIDIKNLEEAVRRYGEASGGPASQLADLVAAGILSRIPLDPFGKPYKLGEGGAIETTSSIERLRLKPGARAQLPPAP